MNRTCFSESEITMLLSTQVYKLKSKMLNDYCKIYNVTPKTALISYGYAVAIFELTPFLTTFSYHYFALFKMPYDNFLSDNISKLLIDEQKSANIILQRNCKHVKLNMISLTNEHKTLYNEVYEGRYEPSSVWSFGSLTADNFKDPNIAMLAKLLLLYGDFCQYDFCLHSIVSTEDMQSLMLTDIDDNYKLTRFVMALWDTVMLFCDTIQTALLKPTNANTHSKEPINTNITEATHKLEHSGAKPDNKTLERYYNSLPEVINEQPKTEKSINSDVNKKANFKLVLFVIFAFIVIVIISKFIPSDSTDSDAPVAESNSLIGNWYYNNYLLFKFDENKEFVCYNEKGNVDYSGYYFYMPKAEELILNTLDGYQYVVDASFENGLLRIKFVNAKQPRYLEKK